jgi:hypothetical protein
VRPRRVDGKAAFVADLKEGEFVTVQSDVEPIRDVVARLIERCATSDGRSVLVVWSIDSEESFVPQQEGLQLHQDSLEFTDTDGTPTVLPFSRIARIEIDEDDTR